jgi:hypothetical protein
MTDGPQTTPGTLAACRECGARLAADQRYCLNCGGRHGEPRLDFRRHLFAGAAPSSNGHAAPTASPPAGDEQKPPRDFTPLAAAGGIAVLGLMLLVGVLIGRGDGNQAVVPPPQVVRVQGGGEEGTAASGGGGALGGGGSQKAGAKATGKGGTPAGGSAKAPPPEITADDSELEALQEQSPEEYAENSAKLPDEIATEGEPPPEDGKRPGGGSAGTTIE